MVTVAAIQHKLKYLKNQKSYKEGSAKPWAKAERQEDITSYLLSQALDMLIRTLNGISPASNILEARSRLETFFKNFWEESPCYTALNANPVIDFFCEIAISLTKAVNEGLGKDDTPLGLIAMLMPTAYTISNHLDYPDLHPTWDAANEKWVDIADIKLIINTHILGDDYCSLIPVRVMDGLNLLNSKPLLHVYKENGGILSQAELDRLKRCTPLYEAFLTYQELIEKANTLLVWLSRLIAAPEVNSIHLYDTRQQAEEILSPVTLNFPELYIGFLEAYNDFLQIHKELPPEARDIPDTLKNEEEIIKELIAQREKIAHTQNPILLQNCYFGLQETVGLTAKARKEFEVIRQKILKELETSVTDPLFTTWGTRKLKESEFRSLSDLRLYISNQPPEHLAWFLSVFGRTIWGEIIQNEYPECAESVLKFTDFFCGLSGTYNPQAALLTAKIVYALLDGMSIEKMQFCLNNFELLKALFGAFFNKISFSTEQMEAVLPHLFQTLINLCPAPFSMEQIGTVLSHLFQSFLNLCDTFPFSTEQIQRITIQLCTQGIEALRNFGPQSIDYFCNLNNDSPLLKMILLLNPLNREAVLYNHLFKTFSELCRILNSPPGQRPLYIQHITVEMCAQSIEYFLNLNEDDFLFQMIRRLGSNSQQNVVHSLCQKFLTHCNTLQPSSDISVEIRFLGIITELTASLPDPKPVEILLEDLRKMICPFQQASSTQNSSEKISPSLHSYSDLSFLSPPNLKRKRDDGGSLCASDKQLTL